MPKFIGYNKIEFAANIALFVPLGCIAIVWVKKTGLSILIGFSASLLFELGQATLLPKRYASGLDILANTLGTAIGVAAYILERKHNSRQAKSSLAKTFTHDQLTSLHGRLPMESFEASTSSGSRILTDSRLSPPIRRFPSWLAPTLHLLNNKPNQLISRLRSKKTITAGVVLVVSMTVLAIVLVTAGGSTPTLATQESPATGIPTIQPSPLPTPSSSPTSKPKPTPRSSHTPAPASVLPPKKPIAAFIGDDFAIGVGASGRESGWAEILARKRGWDPRNLAHKNTGYASFLTGSPALAACDRQRCPRYAELVERLKSIQPSIVVVSGGQRDIWQGTPSTAAEIDNFYRSLSSALPRARIIAVSPTWGIDPPPETLHTITQQVKKSATKVGAKFVDIGQPLRDRTDLVVDSGQYPNDAGHRSIAKSISAKLDASKSY